MKRPRTFAAAFEQSSRKKLSQRLLQISDEIFGIFNTEERVSCPE